MSRVRGIRAPSASRTGSELGEFDAALQGEGLVCVHPSLMPPSRLAPLLRPRGKADFVVEDMTGLDGFRHRRRDEYRWLTPDAQQERGRPPLTIRDNVLACSPARKGADPPGSKARKKKIAERQGYELDAQEAFFRT